MTTTPANVVNNSHGKIGGKALRWRLAKSYPVITFILITFAWSWLIWFASIPLHGQNSLLLTLVTFVGSFGPAIGGILTLGLKNGLTLDLSGRKLMVMGIASIAIFALMVLRYMVGVIPGYDRIPEDLKLSTPIIAAAVFVCLLGGWVVSSSASSNPDICQRMASVLPSRSTLNWTLAGFLFYPAVLSISWGAALLAGLKVTYPGLWGRSIFEVLTLFLLAFTLTALVRGGLEEPGWRGVMQPEIQRKFNPLVAALIVGFIWNLWHLPLFINGFYADDIVAGMIGGGVYKIVLAVIWAWFYNHSRGNILMMVILHTASNVMVGYIPRSDSILVILLLLSAIIMVIADKMWRKLPVES